MVTYCFGENSEIFLSAKPDVLLEVAIAPMQNIFNVKYLENSQRHDVGFKGFFSGVGNEGSEGRKSPRGPEVKLRWVFAGEDARSWQHFL